MISIMVCVCSPSLHIKFVNSQGVTSGGIFSLLEANLRIASLLEGNAISLNEAEDLKRQLSIFNLPETPVLSDEAPKKMAETMSLAYRLASEFTAKETATLIDTLLNRCEITKEQADMMIRTASGLRMIFADPLSDFLRTAAAHEI